MTLAMHFDGGIRIEARGRISIRLAGWPCCCSGLKAMRMPKEQMTGDAREVTCKACIATMLRDVSAVERFEQLPKQRAALRVLQGGKR